MSKKELSKLNYNSISDDVSDQNSRKLNITRICVILATAVIVAVCLFQFVSYRKVANEDESVIIPEFNFPSKSSLYDDTCTVVSDDFKFDCFPRGKSNQQSCEERNCCWSPPVNDSDSLVPWCYYSTNYNNYKVVNVTQSRNGLVAYFNLSSETTYKDNIKLLCMDVSFHTAQRLRIKIYDAENSRYEPPYPEIPAVHLNNSKINKPLVSDYAVIVAENQLGFAVVRKNDNVTLFDSRNVGGFIYSDQFIQISALLPTKYIYGIGEQRADLMLDMNWKVHTLFNHDSPPTNNVNGYGAHPFYLIMEKSGKSHGVFLFNSNAMDVVLQPAPAITFRTIGGILDFFYFMGPTPADVIAQYTETIGRPYLPPYWSLGFHLCRFGQTLDQVIEVHNRTVNAGIPWDTHWNDIDYMKRRNDFTLSNNFSGLPGYVEHLHKIGMHHVVILDPGISSREPKGTYPPYDDGLKQGIFIKNSTGLPLEGQVWNKNGGTVFPDFTNPKTVSYWIDQVSKYHQVVAFDGLWIDMNEPSNFVNGDWQGCVFNDSNHWENPQYVPAIQGGVLNYKTICMSAKQHGGLHYNLHNLYGFSEAITTQFVLSVITSMRPLVISRSSYAGLGHFTGHWTGDVYSTWDDLKQSITDTVVFNMFGIPLVGADICGFNGNTTVELCSRWSQLGAFYPFSRNHNSDDCFDQDPVALGPLVVNSARKALMIRYSLLPYLYSLFWKAHTDGETVARPLFFEYPLDENTYNVDTQFLWGPALLISPVLKENQEEVKIYLPNDTWYDYYSKSAIESNGSMYTVAAPLDTIPLSIRGGYILPTQDPSTTTTLSRKNPFGLLIAPNASGEAYGYLFWDDGKSLNVWENGLYNEIHFKYQSSAITAKVVTNNYPNEKLVLQNITVFGIQANPTSVIVNRNAHQNFFYNMTEHALYFKSLNLDLFTVFSITWT